jgi:hypothetical protein
VAGGNFVRRAGESTSYVVEPGISFEAEPRYWIDTTLLDIPSNKIQSIEFKPATGPVYSVHRVAEPSIKPADAKKPGATPAPTPPATKFVLEGVPSGRRAADPQTLAPAPNFLSSLADEDVSQAGDVDFSRPMIVTVTLADGSLITLTGTAVGDKRWIQVAAPKDAALSAKAKGRAFEIATYRYDGIFKPLEQLLVPKPEPKAKPSSGPKASPAAAPAASKKPATAPRP